MTQEWAPRARVRRSGEALTEIFHEEGEEAWGGRQEVRVVIRNARLGPPGLPNSRPARSPSHQGRSPAPASPYSSSRGAGPQRHVQARPTHPPPPCREPPPPRGPLAPHTDNGPRRVTRPRRRHFVTSARRPTPRLRAPLPQFGLQTPACSRERAGQEEGVGLEPRWREMGRGGRATVSGPGPPQPSASWWSLRPQSPWVAVRVTRPPFACSPPRRRSHRAGRRPVR